jgi:hypothetical protein
MTYDVFFTNQVIFLDEKIEFADAKYKGHASEKWATKKQFRHVRQQFRLQNR